MTKPNLTISHSLSTLTVILLLIIWQIYAISVDNPYLMPDPIKVFGDFFGLLGEWSTYVVIATTLTRLIISIALSTFFGLVLGLMSGVHYQVEAILKPIVVSLRTLPVISIIVVVLILLGSNLSLYVVSFLLLFPLIYQAELEGIKNIDSLLLDVLRLDCKNCSWPAVKMVFFPLALPYLRTAILQSAGLGIKVLVVAEFIAQTSTSIGRELYFNRINLEYSKVFAWTMILIIIVLIIEHFVNRYVKYEELVKKNYKLLDVLFKRDLNT